MKVPIPKVTPKAAILDCLNLDNRCVLEMDKITGQFMIMEDKAVWLNLFRI